MISIEQLAELYNVSLKEAAIIRTVLGYGRHGISKISRETGIPRKEVEETIFSNSSCETIRIIRQFTTF